MLTRKAKYALKALSRLAEAYGKEPVQIVNLAERDRIPRKFLESILLELKRAGILASKKGPGGGYYLTRPPQEVQLVSILRSVDGPVAPAPCVSKTAYHPCEECVDVASCGLRLVMRRLRDATLGVLETTTLAELVHIRETIDRLPANAGRFAI